MSQGHPPVSDLPWATGGAAGIVSREAAPELRPEAVLPAFEQVYAQWFHAVRRWARAFGSPAADSEDLAQEVFLIVRRKLPDFDGTNLAGWLYLITRRTVRDYRRAAWFRRFWKRTAKSGEDPSQLEGLAPIADLSLEMEQRQAWQKLDRILERMSEKQRVVFVLFEVEGYSGQEIAELEGVKLATVWSRLHQARATLAASAAELEGSHP